MALSVTVPGNSPYKIKKWKVKKGQRVASTTILALYQIVGSDAICKLKCNNLGTVKEFMLEEGQEGKPGSIALTLNGCQHPTVMKDMCAECGADLRLLRDSGWLPATEKKSATSASVAMVHSIPELIVSEEQALELGKEDERRLLKNRKLVLLVDLDQTLLHTTNDTIPPNLKDVEHFQLWHGRWLWYHTKFRPGTKAFLESVSQKYELHICTFGVRLYAHTIAGFVDPDKKYFSHRILSRDECFSANSKTANLKALFPCGDSMVCIIDDRDDVWKFAPNLIHVKPYHFFCGTADINAPPGLGKDAEDSQSFRHKVKIMRVPREKKMAGVQTQEANQSKSISDDENNKKQETYGKVQSKENTAEERAGKVTKNISKSTTEPSKTDAVDTFMAKSVGEEKPAISIDKSKIPVDDSSQTEPKANRPDSEPGKVDNKNVVDSAISSELVKVDSGLDSETAGIGKDSEVVSGETPSCDPVSQGADTAATTVGSVSANSGDIADDMMVSESSDSDSECDASETKPADSGKSKPADSGKSKPADSGKTKPADSGKTKPADSGKSKPADSGKSKTVLAGVNTMEIVEKNSNVTPGVKQEDIMSESIGDSSNVEGSTKEDVSGDISKEDSGLVSAQNAKDDLTDKKDTGSQEVNKTVEPEVGDLTSENDKEKSDKRVSSDEYDEIIEWEDTDDYLIYLEDVLKRIHAAYYEMYDQMQLKDSSEIPDMKRIIPYVRRKVLQGVNILFSGVIPTNQQPEKSRAYNVARSLGANIHTMFVAQDDTKKGDATTHLVAAKVGTAKVMLAKKHKNVHIVNPEWLWTCTERWEMVDERLFPLTDDSVYPYADSPDPWKPKKKKKVKEVQAKNIGDKPDPKDAHFQDYNPLYAFSTSDIKQMGDEVDEIFDESESDDSESELRRVVLGFGKKRQRESSSEESLTAEFPKGWGKKKKRNQSVDATTCEDGDIVCEDDDESEMQRKIVENPDSLLGNSDQSSNNSSDFQESICSVDDEMAAALEREFLSY